MLLIKEGNSEAVIRDLVLSSHFSKLKSSLGTNKAAAKLGKLEQSLHITQDFLSFLVSPSVSSELMLLSALILSISRAY
jgi:hypothetical protein